MPGTREETSDLWNAIYTQRAIRRWEKRPVPRELLWRVLEAATKAPSGSNLQPWRFIVVEDAERRAAIADLLQPKTEQAKANWDRITATTRDAERGVRLMLTGARGLVEDLDQAPVFIIPCLYKVTSPTTDMKDLLAGSSIYMAVQNLLLAARGLGLGTVFTTFQRGIDAGLRPLLGIPDDAMPAALIPLGYPAANFGPTSRHPVEQVTFWDGWDRTAARVSEGTESGR
jgi:nitroreductase